MSAATTPPTPPTEDRIDAPSWGTVTLAVAEGASTADSSIYGAFAVHIGGFNSDQFGGHPVTNHRFYFHVTHVGSGVAAATDLENREAHYLAREFAACPAFIALCDARGAGDPAPMTSELAEWYHRTLRDTALAYGAFAAGGSR